MEWESRFQEWKSKVGRGELEGAVETMYELLKESSADILSVFQSITDPVVDIITIDLIVYKATNKGQRPASLRQIMHEGSRAVGRYVPPSFSKQLGSEQSYQELLQISIKLGGTRETNGNYIVTQKAVDAFKAMDL